MKKQIKVWYHTGPNSDIREFLLPKSLLWFMGLIFLCSICGFSWISYDYFQLKHTFYDNAGLRDKLVKKSQLIQDQRKQIQKFAADLEILKNNVIALTDLGEKVRLIADIKKTGDQSGFIGIGGIPMSELDPDLPLDSRHNRLIREMHSQVNQTQALVKSEKTDFNALIEQLEQKKNMLASIPSIWPVKGCITSKFGYRTSPFTGKQTFHSGLDIANKIGTKVIATANGTVSYAARKMHFGNLVVIDHGYGKATKYGHLSKILVTKGQKVKRGDVIALLGNSGKSTGPHVHYEVVSNGIPLNPLKYILN